MRVIRKFYLAVKALTLLKRNAINGINLRKKFVKREMIAEDFREEFSEVRKEKSGEKRPDDDIA